MPALVLVSVGGYLDGRRLPQRATRVLHHPVIGSRHVGPRGYLATSKDAAGTSNLARTVAVTARLLQHDLQR